MEKYSQTVGKRTVIDDILKVALLSQRLFGQQVLDPGWSWTAFGHYHAVGVGIYVYVFFGTLSVINNTDSDIDLITEAFYTMVVLFISPLKLTLFFFNGSVFRKVYITMKSEIFDMICQEYKDDEINRILKTINKIVYVLFSLVLIPFIAYELVTAWNYLNGNRLWMSSSTDILLPMSSPYFEICWILHSIFFMEVCMTVAPLDMWFVILLYFYCLASDSLAKMLKIDGRGNNEDVKAYSKRLDQCLKMFYTNHIKLVKYYSLLLQMYKWLALVPLVNVALSICIVLQVLTEGFKLQFVPHIFPLFAEVFAYSWFGERLKTKMYELRIALLNFEWTSLARGDLRKYHIMVVYMSREFGVATAVGHDLSLITMTNVFKGSYQAFTVLQTR